MEHSLFRTKFSKLILAILAVLLLLGAWEWFSNARQNNRGDFSEGVKKDIVLSLNNFDFSVKNSQAASVGDFLKEQKINLTEKDWVYPMPENKIYFGSKITVLQARKIIILDNKEEIKSYIVGNTIADALRENNIQVREEDIVFPPLQSLAHEEEKIKITRVDIKEEIKTKEIDFGKVTKEDDELGWRQKKITQKGEKGKEEIKYKVVYHNDQEISRKILERKVIQEPVPEISTQGTYMKLGKAKTGQASHYAASWGNLNASRDIPRGSYAKVTNLENGKSAVVKINDFGPISKERIIDLNFNTFVQLANDWQGIIPRVKVEQILN